MNILQIELRISADTSLLLVLSELVGVLRGERTAQPTPEAPVTDRPTIPPEKMQAGAIAPSIGQSPRGPVNVAKSAGAVAVDYETALRWSAERGLGNFRLDLDLVNLKRKSLGLAPFVLMEKR